MCANQYVWRKIEKNTVDKERDECDGYQAREVAVTNRNREKGENTGNTVTEQKPRPLKRYTKIKLPAAGSDRPLIEPAAKPAAHAPAPAARHAVLHFFLVTRKRRTRPQAATCAAQPAAPPAAELGLLRRMPLLALLARAPPLPCGLVRKARGRWARARVRLGQLREADALARRRLPRARRAAPGAACPEHAPDELRDVQH